MKKKLLFAILSSTVILCIMLAAVPNAHASFVYTSALEVVNPVSLTLNPNALAYSPTGDITNEIVYCGLGTPSDFPPSVAGKIALIQRGTYTFYYKTYNAELAGALAAIIYNNVVGNFAGTLGQVTGIPAVSISDTEGASLLSLLGSGSVVVHLTVGPNLAGPPFIESSDSGGTPKDTFLMAEEVYVIGDGYVPSTSYDIYVVNDVASWVDGMAIPSRVSGTATSISSDSNGIVAPTLVWNDPLAVGKYDIVVDVDGNGIYDASKDALDSNDIQVTAGFNVIPEVPFGTIIAFASMFMALVAFVGFKRFQPKFQMQQKM